MNDVNSNPEEVSKKSSALLGIFALIFLIAFLYLLSPVLFFFLLDYAPGTFEPLVPFFDVILFPIMYLCEKFEIVESFYIYLIDSVTS